MRFEGQRAACGESDHRAGNDPPGAPRLNGWVPRSAQWRPVLRRPPRRQRRRGEGGRDGTTVRASDEARRFKPWHPTRVGQGTAFQTVGPDVGWPRHGVSGRDTRRWSCAARRFRPWHPTLVGRGTAFQAVAPGTRRGATHRFRPDGVLPANRPGWTGSCPAGARCAEWAGVRRRSARCGGRGQACRVVEKPFPTRAGVFPGAAGPAVREGPTSGAGSVWPRRGPGYPARRRRRGVCWARRW